MAQNLTPIAGQAMPPQQQQNQAPPAPPMQRMTQEDSDALINSVLRNGATQTTVNNKISVHYYDFVYHLIR